MNEGEDRVLLGRIAGAHGLKGEVKIAAFTAQPEDVAAYGPLSTADGARVFEITSLRRSGGGSVIAWLQGVTDRNEAEQLRGTALYVSRAALPAAEEDEYYHSDLIGLAAVSTQGEPLGEITGIQNFGAGDLLEVRAPGSRQSQLIPFERAHVPKVDLETGCVIVIWPVYESGGNKDTE
jgi:16S rRNA processing protein RimM